jgi:tetratricopeptide (TPR) repeat protein
MAESSGRIFPAFASRPFETWQVGAVRLPVWFPRLDGDPFRVWIAVCLNLDSGRLIASEPGPEEDLASLLEGALSRAGKDWRSRPARVQVADAAWSQGLDGLLSSHGVTVETRPELPELSHILADFPGRMAPDDPRPGPLAGAGVTLERLAAFARAAAGFVEASGWRHLQEEDRVRIEAPAVETDLRCFILVHDGGRSAPDLYFEAEDSEAGDGEWTVELLKPWDAPPADTELWERHGLPWAGDGFIPVAGFWQDGDFHRPDHRQLALFEGLFAALAATAEEDLDAGSWEKQVSTAQGTMGFVLSLPDLLEPPEQPPPGPQLMWRFLERSMRQMGKSLAGGGDLPLEWEEEGFPIPLGESEPDTPEERAEALLDQAHVALGRRAVLLARQALAAWPDCADAYNLLARRAPDLESAGRFYELGMAAGARAVGPAAFDEAGHFWGLLETRPYMRARQGLAETLMEMGRLVEAAEQFQEMLRLNPNDNQGVRHSLVNLLIALDRDGEAWGLLESYTWDTLALLAYPRALLGFRREGDSLAARKSLKRALQANRFVPGMLLHTRGMPPPAGFYTPGREDEAGLYLALSMGTWAGTAGALDWLRQRTAAPVRPRKNGKAKKRQEKKRPKRR